MPGDQTPAPVTGRLRSGLLAVLMCPLLCLVIGLMTAGCGGGAATNDSDGGVAVSRPGNHGYNGVYLDQPYQAAPVGLRSDRGEPIDLAELKGLNLIFFGYTKCPDICQTVMSTIASSLTRLPKEQAEKINVYLITTDPPRDSPSVLRTYLDRFNPDFVGVTGSMNDIVAAAKPMGIEIAKGEKLPGGGYDVNHGTHTFALVNGKVPVLWTAATSPAEMTADLSRLLKASA